MEVDGNVVTLECRDMLRSSNLHSGTKQPDLHIKITWCVMHIRWCADPVNIKNQPDLCQIHPIWGAYQVEKPENRVTHPISMHIRLDLRAKQVIPRSAFGENSCNLVSDRVNLVTSGELSSFGYFVYFWLFLADALVRETESCVFSRAFSVVHISSPRQINP